MSHRAGDGEHGLALACGGAGDQDGFLRAKRVLRAVEPEHAAFWESIRWADDPWERAEQVFRVYDDRRNRYQGTCCPVHMPNVYEQLPDNPSSVS